ncbi:MAG: ROK family protein [Phycisphaeraceae bacterium]|nr:ROK family protein [Phycisphaeraceae bacterium]
MVILAADIGGTSIKLGLIQDGRLLARDGLAVRDRRRLSPLLTPMAERWRAMLPRADRTGREVHAVALAFAGVVDGRGRRVVSTNGKFDDAPDLDLVRWATQALGATLWIENDARAALLGERMAGAGVGADDVAMVTLGTGIGAAAVIDGRLVRGSHGLAGMFGGHLTVDLHGRPCRCGNVGCAEAEASTDRLPEIASSIAKARGLTAPWLAERTLDYARLMAWAQAGDELAVAVREHSLAVWSAAVVNVIHAYGSERIVLGGGIVQGSPWIVDTFQQYVDRHAWTPWGRTKLCPAALGDDAALVGCGCLPGMHEAASGQPNRKPHHGQD